jgi:hypothetical protein
MSTMSLIRDPTHKVRLHWADQRLIGLPAASAGALGSRFDGNALTRSVDVYNWLCQARSSRSGARSSLTRRPRRRSGSPFSRTYF